ncbi:MAG: ABC transporter substrate-binding protein [Mycobacteriaceae bacterium]
MTSHHLRRWAVPTAVAVSLGLLLSACGNGSAASGADAGPPKSGGTLRYALSASPICPDPQQAAQNMAVYVARQVADSLTDQDPKTGEIKPWLATSWEVSPDAKSFTFHLRDGVSFSDGTPLDATSVKHNLDGIVKLGASASLGGSYLSGYAGTTVTDPRTAVVTFKTPNVQFLQASSTFSLALLSEATLALTPEKRCQGTVVGSGPFVFSAYVQDQKVALTKRTGYTWGSTLFGHPGDAYLDGIDFSIVPESGVRAGSLASKQLDAISDVLPQDEQQITGIGGSVLTTANPGVVFNLQTNVSTGALKDPAVRKALQVGINRKEVVETVLGPNFRPATSILSHTTPGYTDLSSELRFDPNAAKAALDGAGWTAGADGIRQKDGQRLTIDTVFIPAFAGSKAALELVQQQLRTIGVDFKIRLLTSAQITAVGSSGDYNTYFYNVTRADADILRTSFSSTYTNRNRRAPDNTLDPLLSKQLTDTDTATRNADVAAAQREIVQQGYAIPLFELSQAIGVSSTVHGLGFEASARLQFFDTWLSGQGS